MNADTRLAINRYLNVLVVVLAASIPLYRRWVSVAVPLIFLLWLIEGRLPEKFAALKRHGTSLAGAAFVGFAMLSLAWSVDPAEGLDYLGKYRYLLLIPIIATSLRRSYRPWVEHAFIAGTAVSLVLSFGVFAGLLHLRDAHRANPSPTMSHLDYSMILAVAAALVLARILERRELTRQTVAMWILLISLVGGLAVNIGRSGQAAFVGAALIMVPTILAGRSRRTAVAGAVATALILASSYVMIGPFHRRVDAGVAEVRAAIVDHDFDSNQGMRIAGALVARDMVREHPIVGTGVGGNMVRFRELLSTRHPALEPEISWFPHFHNQYLQIVTETGIIGLITLVVLMGALWVGPYIEPHDRHVATLLAVIFLIGFLGDPFLHKQLPLVLFATFAGLVSARGRSMVWDDEPGGSSG